MPTGNPSGNRSAYHTPASKHPTYNYGHTRPTRVGGWVRTQTMPKTRGSLRADAKTTSQPATRRLPASLIHMNTLGCLGHTPRSPTLHTAGDSGSPLYRVCLSPRLRLSPSLILSFGSDFPCPRAFPCAGCGLPFRLAPYRLPPCGRSRVAASPVLREGAADTLGFTSGVTCRRSC